MSFDDSTPQQEGAVDSVTVTFFTTSFPHVVPEDQTFAVPLTTLPEGLSTLVNALLELEPAIPMDFLINDEYITTTLEKFMRRRRLTVEDTLHIEYTPAMQAQEGSKLPHDDWVSSVVAPVFGDPSILFTGAYDHCVRLWNAEDCVAIGTAHTAAVKEVRLHPSALTTSASAPAPSKAAKGSRKSGRNQGASEVGSFYAASVGKDGCLIAWQYDSENTKLTPLNTTAQHVDSVDTLDIHPGGEWVATGSWDTIVKVFRWEEVMTPSDAIASSVAAPTKGATPLWSFADHARAVLKVRFSPSHANRLYSTGLDGSVKLWDIEKGQLLTTLTGDHSINALSLKPGGDSDMVLTGHTDNRLRLFDVRTKKPVKVWSGHRQWVYTVAWQHHAMDSNNNSNLLISGSEDATLRIWDLRSTTNSLVTMDLLHTDGILDCTYVGNNEVASCGKDNLTKTATLKSYN